MYEFVDFLDGTTIKCKKNINKCKTNNCYQLKMEILKKVEEHVEEMYYLDNNDENLDIYNVECEDDYYCIDCNNKIICIYNPADIYYKYVK